MPPEDERHTGLHNEFTSPPSDASNLNVNRMEFAGFFNRYRRGQITFLRTEMTVKFNFEWGSFFVSPPSQENSGLLGKHFEVCSLAGHAD